MTDANLDRSKEAPLVSFGARIRELARRHPESTAVFFLPEEGPEERLTWAELDFLSNCWAHRLADQGIDETSRVVIGLVNSPAHILASVGTWKLGGCVIPLSAKLPEAERKALLELIKPQTVVTRWDDCPSALSPDLPEKYLTATGTLPDRTAQPGKGIGSGGSTGRPKVIIDPNPWAFPKGAIIDLYGPLVGVRSGQVQLLAGPLYHNAPFCWCYFGLFENHTLILMERFDAEKAVTAIEQYQVQFTQMVPTMMRRILQLPGIEERDLSSLESVYHTGGVCPVWVKEGWIRLIGPTKIFEVYGTTESFGATVIRGDQWLEHPGSVGRPYLADFKVLDEEGSELPAGEVGEIFMRPHQSTPTFEYLGAPPLNKTDDGFMSAGDMGWMDEDGFVYLADRHKDKIVTGGANVFPAEVEAVLTQHPEVRDAVVIGLPDEDWGSRVHALIEPKNVENPPSKADLESFCREWLVGYKVPKSYEFSDKLPRNEAGKIRRSQLVQERS